MVSFIFSRFIVRLSIRRIFEVLGFDEYWNGHDDGLQILRYNTTAAYTQHMDYMTDRSGQELFVSWFVLCVT
jgi:hypothetical protein